MSTHPVPPAHHAGQGVSIVNMKDINSPPVVAMASGHSGGSGRLASVPFKKTRVWLHVAALLLALATVVVQAILISNKQKVSDILSDDALDLAEDWVDIDSAYLGDIQVKAKWYAKEPSLVVAVGAIAVVFAVTLLVTAFFPAVRASLWGAILEVCLVPAVLGLWLGALGVSGKTADVLGNSTTGVTWPKVWIILNAIVLGLESASVIIWTITLVISIISLARVAQAFRAHRAAQRAAPQPPGYMAGGGIAAAHPSATGFYAA